MEAPITNVLIVEKECGIKVSEITMFRAKTKKGNKWVYGELIHDNDRPYIVLDFYRKKSGKMKIKAKRVKKNTIGIYMNEYDKNYSPMYEDDIVEINDYLYIVSYYPGHLEDLYDVKNDKFLCARFKDRKDVEVVGNIYDNPELLEKVKSQ